MNQPTQNTNVVNNVKSVLHVVSIGLSVVCYFNPHLAILTVAMTTTNALLHALTTN